MFARLGLAVIFVSLPLIASAQEELGWTGEISANGSSTTGNNNTTDVGIALKLKNRGTDWRHDFKASTDYGRADGKTRKRRYRLGYKIGRDLAPRVYSFINADYYSDDFGAYKHGYYLGGGIGYSALIDGPTLWRLESGAGYRSQKARLKTPTEDGRVSLDENSPSARLYSDFEHKFNERVTLSNDTELFYSDLDTFIINEVAVKSELFRNIALRASFRVENHSDVPVGRKNTDTISRIGIVYSMK